MIIKRFTSGFLGMNSVFIAADNKNGVLVDPGVYPPELTKIINFLNKNDYLLEGILFTHMHGDHFSGWYKFNGIDCFSHEIMLNIESQDQEKDLQFIQNMYSKFDYDPIMVKYPANINHLKEGEIIDVTGNKFAFYSTPGHASAHSAIIMPEANLIISGDMLIPNTIPFILNSVDEYKKSLDKILSLVKKYQISKLAPGHANFLHSQIDIIKKIDEEKKYVVNLVLKGEQYFHKSIEPDIFSEKMINAFPECKKKYQHLQNIKTLYKQLNKNGKK